MAIVYVVQPFSMTRGGPAARPPVVCTSEVDALRRADALEGKVAGVLAYRQVVDPDLDEYGPIVVLRTHGAVPAEALGCTV